MPDKPLLELDRDGAQHFAQLLSPDDVDAIQLGLRAYDQGRPGLRLTQLKALEPWLGAKGPVGQLVANWLGAKGKPVRAILFDKNATSNWALGWHQDRTIAVAGRAEVSDFTNWNRKGGVDHVEPPFSLIERMITVRLHLDPVTSDNAPLLISPGSHRIGKVAEGGLPDVIERHGTFQCLAQAGDVWVYRTPIVHASKRATLPSRRRVLQVDYSADDLPDPLRWMLAS